MEKQFTIETRLELQEDAVKYLTEYVVFYNEISRKLWQIVRLSNFKELYTRSEFNTYACNKYNILKRTANSIYSDLAGKKKSLLELKKTELSNKKIRYKKFFNKKNELINKINKLKEKVALNKSNENELIRYRKYKHKYYFICNKINNLKQDVENLEKDIKNKNIKISFGSKKLFNAQYNLEANGFRTHTKWKNNYHKKRDKNIYYLGSKDETLGNQLAQLDYDITTSKFTLKFRKEKQYSSESKYLNISNIDFKYMKDELINIINDHKSNQTLLPLSYRIYRVKNKWYLQVIITTIVENYVTRKEYGVIGLDFNNGFISFSETNESGNLIKTLNYPLKYHGCGNKALNEMLNTINNIVTYARSVGKDISIEDLKFDSKKANSIKSNQKNEKKYNKMIHTLDYSRYIFRLENKCHKMQVSLNKVNPYNTSLIGYEKYAKNRKMTIHQAASFVITRRHQGFIDKI